MFRTACRAMAPSVPKLASSSVTPSGIAARRFSGTAFSSAWLAMPAPAMATRSPTRNRPSSPAPTATTSPAAE